MNDLTAVEVRVLGALLEKQRLTPDVYPLTLNALRHACNQVTSREPLTHYDDATIREALDRLHARNYTRLASGAGSRSPKYRHLLAETLGLNDGEQALIAALALRGPQTAAELRARTERMYPFPSQGAVDGTLETLAGSGYVVLHDRRPGEKAARWGHLLSGRAPGELGHELPPPPLSGPPADGADRIDRLEAEVAAMRAELAALREQIGGDAE